MSPVRALIRVSDLPRFVDEHPCDRDVGLESTQQIRSAVVVSQIQSTWKRHQLVMSRRRSGAPQQRNHFGANGIIIVKTEVKRLRHVPSNRFFIHGFIASVTCGASELTFRSGAHLMSRVPISFCMCLASYLTRQSTDESQDQAAHAAAAVGCSQNNESATPCAQEKKRVEVRVRISRRARKLGVPSADVRKPHR